MIGSKAVVLDQIRYFRGEDPCLARAGAGKNKLGPLRVNDRFPLHVVKDDF